MQYYIIVNSQPQGPFELNELPSKGLTPDSMVCHEGMTQWQPASSVPEVMALLNNAAGTNNVNPDNDKNIHPLKMQVTECPPSNLALAIVAVILCFPLGIPALVKASLVKKRWAERRYGDAVWLSKTSKKFAVYALYIGFALIMVFIKAYINS